jgi:hypothetical protein
VTTPFPLSVEVELVVGGGGEALVDVVDVGGGGGGEKIEVVDVVVGGGVDNEVVEEVVDVDDFDSVEVLVLLVEIWVVEAKTDSQHTANQ